METKIPLAKQLFGDKRHDCPCGCQFTVDDNGHYTHYVHPDCKFDGKKIGNTLIKGYNYVPWINS